MKILKYKKGRGNEYKILTNEKEYTLYDDIIIKHELLLKKEISKKEWDSILKENNLLKSYYDGLKAINIKLRSEKELRDLLTKKNYQPSEVDYAIKRIGKEGYLNHKVYIEAYIHDALTLNMIGELKILKDLEKLGFNEKEIKSELNKVDKKIYKDKIKKYIDKKLKSNKKSANEFIKKITLDLSNKGFFREDIINYLSTLEIEDNKEEISKIVDKLYNKYINKYDLYTTKMKIKGYLYSKGYTDINIDEYLKRAE